MTKKGLLGIISLSGLLFCFLFFITWQQIEKFSIGYRISSIKEAVRTEEIRRQTLIKEYYSVTCLSAIENKAVKKFGMVLPSVTSSSLISIDSGGLPQDQPGLLSTLTVKLKESFSTRTAEAGR